jgi:hypothetical protein
MLDWYPNALAEVALPGHAGIAVGHLRGMTVKRTILAVTRSTTLGAALSLLFCGAAQATGVDLDATHAVHADRLADISAAARTEVVTPPSPSMSELPEPEVFAMMLVGLVLIGYRASRDSSEKFKKD